MLGPRKQYDSELAAWAKSAELSIPRYFEQIGYAAIHHPNGKYGKDIECKSEVEHFYVEVERRSGKTWKDGEFPYADVHVPERRKESFSKDTMLFIVRYDLKLALVVFYNDVADAPIERHPNRYVQGDEMFCKIDKKRCLPLDLMDSNDRRSIAERNRENILKQWSTGNGNLLLKREVLGKSEPYGMGYEEWTRLLVETEALLEPLLGLAFSSDVFNKRVPYKS